MTRVTTFLVTPAVCFALATGCSDGTGPDRTGPEPASLGAAEPSILIDASRDGGVWWFPQAGSFDPAADHQGLELATYLRARGYRVVELGRPTLITLSMLRSYTIVVRAGEFGGYTADELAAYTRYVDEGGRLLLLADHMRYAPPDELAESFGLVFAGITRGGNVLRFTAGHPITAGLSAVGYGVGSALVAVPGSAVVLGTLDSTSYLDLNDNERQDAGEPSAPPVFGALAFGSGRIVFCGDTNLWEWGESRALLDNVLAWLLEGP